MKKYINRIIVVFSSIVMLAMLLEALIFKQVDRVNAYKITNVLLNQVEDLIQSSRENSEELYTSLKDEYKVRAQSVAYILDCKPSAIYDIEELKKIAGLLSIDEIHIFDKTGKIYSGSVPAYYGYSFDSGEQMGWFKPMLSDKKLSMCQDVTPNTAEGKQLMYAITWNEKGDKMVQIGIEPSRLIEAMQRSEVSTILEEIPVYGGTKLVVFDAHTGEIIAGNLDNDNSVSCSSFVNKEKTETISEIKNGTLKLDGTRHYCSYINDGKYLICVGSSIHANKNVFSVTMILVMAYLIIAGLYVCSVVISKFKSEEEKLSQYNILYAMSKIYYSMHLLDLEKGTAEDFSTNRIVENMRKISSSPNEMLKNMVNHCVGDSHKAKMMEFADFGTIKERLKGKKIISRDFLSIHNHWYRSSLITISVDSKSEVEKAILVFRNIHDEKMKEEVLVHNSTTDELTGLLNRRAYEDELKKLDLASDFVYISSDLNGLKNTNDTIGHDAGDELIRAAAGELISSFGDCGNIFRTGGDEFAVIITSETDSISEKMDDFKNKVSEWSGKLVQSMAISCGYVSSREKEWSSVHEIIKESDVRMYKDKQQFYQKNGVDRRAFHKTFTALGNLYTKILKINLTDDTFRIVKMDKTEQTEEKGYSETISGWLSSFASSGQVFQDDAENYLKNTDINFMREFFRNGNLSLSIYYRRKIGDSFRDVVMEIIPADDYSNESQSCFLYVKDITRR